MTKIPRVRFNLKRKNKDSQTLILLVFRYRGFTLRVSTGLSVCPKDWSDKRQRPIERNGRRDLTAISRELDSLAQLTKDVFIENNFGAILPADLKKAILIRTGRIDPPKEESTPTLLEFLDIHLAKMKGTYKYGSYKAFAGAVRRFKEFVKDEYNGQFNYDDIDWNFRQKFVAWAYEVKNWSIVNVNINLSNLNLFFNEAAKLEYHSKTIFRQRGWKESKKKEGDSTPPVVLTIPELEKLARLNLDGQEKKVRDLFLIGVMTGQRWSDFHNYKPEEFVHDDGEKLLRIRQQKTGNEVYSPLDLFDGIIQAKTLTGLFEEYNHTSPKVTYKAFNIVIKELCKRIGLTHSVRLKKTNGGITTEYTLKKYEAIASHSCRRTFCTLLYKKDLSPAMIMTVSGHKTESQFYSYIGTTAQEGARKLAAELRKMRGQPNLRIAK